MPYEAREHWYNPNNRLFAEIYNAAEEAAELQGWDQTNIIPYHLELKPFIDAEERAPEPPIYKYDVSDDGSSRGVRRLNQVLADIDGIPCFMSELGNKPLELSQQEIAREIVADCLPKIVGTDEWSADPRKFLDILGIKSWVPRGGVLAARQNGKTWTAAIVSAAIMRSCPGVEIENFAAKKDQAAVLQTYVECILSTLGHKVSKNSQQGIIKIEHTEGGKSAFSKFQIFSMNAYVLHGVAHTIALVHEDMHARHGLIPPFCCCMGSQQNYPECQYCITGSSGIRLHNRSQKLPIAVKREELIADLVEHTVFIAVAIVVGVVVV